MTVQRLSDFMRGNIEPIIQAWEDFARTVEPPALTMDDEELRDHVRQMLIAFAADLETPQSDRERFVKSKGMAERDHADTAAETHAEARLLAGYTAAQLVSEYRALRSSVLSLWSNAKRSDLATDMADMTRFNEAVDQALAESVARYEQLVKHSQNMFLAILGHDLRNPLGTLISGASFIIQAGEIPAQYILAATRMLNSAKRMSGLVNDLIDFTRTHLGPGIPIYPKHVDLVPLCTQVIEELSAYHPEFKIQLSAPLKLDAMLDNARVSQMLSNLLGNAIQYGSVDAPIRVSVSASTEDVIITIHNEGPAIPSDKMAVIFDPLVRIDTVDQSGTEGSSLGIGLFIAREIARGHGGNVSAVSDENAGTTFTVAIPRNGK
jgi:signal transduction histidine kinase